MPAEIVVHWEDKKELSTFVNHVAASYDGSICTLRFFQGLPPLIESEDTSVWVEGKQVATFVMTKETLLEMAASLQKVIEQPNCMPASDPQFGEATYLE